ncbi:MAG: hypothetical protein SOW55_06700 [Bacilli bacterium]|nr:hypothetical protein [Bacillales bacterium]MDY2575637.1 hypothetical protein [Bacilli bacterium]
MEYLRFKKSLVEGLVYISGAKNIALALVSSALLIKGRVVLNNVPNIKDISIMLDIAKLLNVDVNFNYKTNRLILDSTNIRYSSIPFSLISQFRASYYFIPILLSLKDDFTFSFPGGCSFQERPIDLHLKAFSLLGINYDIDGSLIHFSKNKLHPSKIIFSKKSVGATINAILLAIQIPGTTILINPSLDVEVLEVIDFFKKANGLIYIENEKIYIDGINKLKEEEYEVKPDRIEMGTFSLIGASLGRILILNFQYELLKPLLDLFDYLNVNYQYDDYLLVEKSFIDRPVKLILSSEPNIHTDLGPLVCSFLLRNNKISIIEDIVYPKRNSYVFELIKMGAKIRIINDKIIIFPHSILHPDILKGSDLRGTMSLVLAGLISNEDFLLEGYNYLSRGYENIIQKLNDINIDVRKVDQ